MTEGHCMRCKVKREMKDEEVVTLANGRKATKGRCKVCDTKMCKMGG